LLFVVSIRRFQGVLIIDQWATMTVNIDAVVEQLLEVREHPRLNRIELNENDIRLIVHKAREIFLSQPVLLELG
jgi:serine/threonine-protein phosphatase PP1 catalytic subunit